jgi:hypothetical protein
MSRTARTAPYRLRAQAGNKESVQLYDLRYTHTEMTRAAREGRRPTPSQTCRRITTYSYGALWCRSGNWFHAEVATRECGARLRARLDSQRIRGLHRAGQSLDDADIPPVRHRHGALWDAW